MEVSTKMNNFSNLPTLFLIELFKYINFKERLKISRVCRNWREVVFSLNPVTLFCYFDFYPKNLRWSYANKVIGYENSLEVCNLNFLQHKLTINFFQAIKKLIIFNIDFGREGIENFEKHIQHFKSLEQLELNGFNFKKKSTFDFPKLRILVLKDVCINNSNYTIDLAAPNLEVFVCWKLICNVRFLESPAKLKYLECVNCNYDFKFNCEFSNLEHLNFFDTTGSIRDDFLSDLPNLKKIVLYNNFSRTDLEQFKRRREAYAMDDLEILFLGFEDVYVKPTIGYNFSHMLQRSNIIDLIENYSKLSNSIVSWPVYVDFSELISQFNEALPNSFFKKFTNIKTLHVGKLKDQLALVEFIRNCGYVEHLRIFYSSLDQRFYDQLNLLSISILEITDEKTGKIENFNFISKLKIFQLKIRFNALPIDLVKCRLENRNLKYFNYKNMDNLNVSISFKKEQFYLNINKKSETKHNNAEAVMNRLKKDRNTKNFLIL